LFTQIADEAAVRTNVRVGLQRTGRLTTRPMIFVGQKLAVTGFDDGIAVRLNDADKARALQIFPCRMLGRRDHIGMRGMVTIPWSAHEHWREFIMTAISAASGG
jgi:hypothetical protein